jgi:hypothetical protein
MKKFISWVWLVTYILLPIYFIITLLVSLFTGHKMGEIISYEWWTFFFLFEIWVHTIVRERLNDAYNVIKGK